MADGIADDIYKEKSVLYRFKELPTNNHATVLVKNTLHFVIAILVV